MQFVDQPIKSEVCERGLQTCGDEGAVGVGSLGAVKQQSVNSSYVFWQKNIKQPSSSNSSNSSGRSTKTKTKIAMDSTHHNPQPVPARGRQEQALTALSQILIRCSEYRYDVLEVFSVGEVFLAMLGTKGRQPNWALNGFKYLLVSSRFNTTRKTSWGFRWN